jgi:hypothetical protein
MVLLVFKVIFSGMAMILCEIVKIPTVSISKNYLKPSKTHKKIIIFTHVSFPIPFIIISALKNLQKKFSKRKL